MPLRHTVRLWPTIAKPTRAHKRCRVTSNHYLNVLYKYTARIHICLAVRGNLHTEP